MTNKKHIDDVQPSTVDEHFQLILKDRDVIQSEFAKVTPNDIPEWYDERLFKTGQELYQVNLLGFSTAQLSGLIAILCVPDILDVLLYTKKSNSLCLSYKRYGETLLLIHELFEKDMLKENSKWFKAVNAIRWKHAIVSKKRVKEGLHGIYQKDMAITQFGFIGYIFICSAEVGLGLATTEQKMGLNHFWRVLGHLLGITDRLNICRSTIAETAELCRRIGYDILAKHLENPDPEFVKLAANAINGLWFVDPMINEGAFMFLTYKMTGVKYKEPLGWYSYLNLKRGEWLLYLCGVPYIGWGVRTLYNLILRGAYWLLENCPIGAWIAFGKENTKLSLYPDTWEN